MDKFKGSTDAASATRAVASGVRSAAPGSVVVEVPVADGGDGTVDAAVSAGFERAFFESIGPLGSRARSSLALSGRRAVVEVANSSGMQLVPAGAVDPLGAHSYGVGLGVRAALQRGATEIVIGLGGSASSDGGAGMLTALGVGLLDARGDRISLGVEGLLSLCDVDLTGLDPRLAGAQIILGGDVDNPLLGEHGAARVFAAQKGADVSDIAVIERALARFAEVTTRCLGESFESAAGAGAAGGIGFAGLAFLGGQMDSGARIVLDLVGLSDQLTHADLVVTGEGQLDQQSERGKAPVAVARAARYAGVQCVAVVGRRRLDLPRVARVGFAAAYELIAIEPDGRKCMSGAEGLLEVVGRQIVADGWV